MPLHVISSSRAQWVHEACCFQLHAAAIAQHRASLAHDDADAITEGRGNDFHPAVIADSLIELPDLCAQLILLVCVWPALWHACQSGRQIPAEAL